VAGSPAVVVTLRLAPAVLALAVAIVLAVGAVRDYRVERLRAQADGALSLARLERAIEHLQAAARLAPGDDLVQADLGRVELMRHQWRQDDAAAERAVAAFNGAIARNPLNADHRADLAWALMRLGRFEEAEAAFEEAIGLDPYNVYYVASLGRLYEAWADRERALATYHRAQSILPTREVGALIRALEGR
jgi:tetratricopeptide (TPR) repeat protein